MMIFLLTFIICILAILIGLLVTGLSFLYWLLPYIIVIAIIMKGYEYFKKKKK